jgi:Domain of unknown function (DUF4129)
VLVGERMNALATPRDALRLSRERPGGARDIEPLTGLVERVAYSRATPTAADLEQVQRAAHATLRDDASRGASHG